MRFIRLQPIMALALMIAGCGQPNATTSSPASSVAEKPAQVTSSESDDVLTNAIYQMRPENFGINAAMDKPVSLLNSWRIKQSDKVDSSAPVSVPEGWTPAGEETRLNQAKYDLADAMHIRDALFHHTVAGYLSDRDRDELKRAAIVVDFVCQNIALWKDNEIEIPFPPFLALQLGRGSADDRAWVSAEILRQLRLDSIILRSKKDVKESTDQWLFGVIIDKQVYLFDMRLGLPVPGDPSDNGKPIASLAGLESHPEWLEQFATNEPYHLSVEEIRESAIYVISPTNFWPDRMRKLEQALPAEEICVLYDPLTVNGSHSGLLNRISAIGHWPVESLKLWKYPRRQAEELRSPPKEIVEELQRMLMPLNVPIPITAGADGKPVAGNPERKLQRFRIDHLMGKFSEATKKYVSIRHLEVERNPPEIDRLNRMAAEDAFYWTCLCKYETREYEAAAEQLTAYLKKYDRKGKWYFSARALLARTYAELGQIPQAVETLQRPSAEDPYRQENAIRVKRWQGENEKSAK